VFVVFFVNVLQFANFQDGGGALATGMASTLGMRRASIRAHRRASIPILHSGARYRGGIVQLMVHTLDPLTERTFCLFLSKIRAGSFEANFFNFLFKF
jgi:hypothetical protein